MTVIDMLTFAMLGVAALLCIVRMLRGRSFPDRAISGLYLDVMVVAALLGFTGTALVARFIERRGAR